MFAAASDARLTLMSLPANFLVSVTVTLLYPRAMPAEAASLAAAIAAAAALLAVASGAAG